MSLWAFLPLSWGPAVIVMAGLWGVAQRRRQASISDVAWAALIGVFTLAFAGLSGGDPARRVLVAVLGVTWSMRLAACLVARIRSLPEDGCYEGLRSSWGDNPRRNFFVFFKGASGSTNVHNETHETGGL